MVAAMEFTVVWIRVHGNPKLFAVWRDGFGDGFGGRGFGGFGGFGDGWGLTGYSLTMAGTRFPYFALIRRVFS